MHITLQGQNFRSSEQLFHSQAFHFREGVTSRTAGTREIRSIWNLRRQPSLGHVQKKLGRSHLMGPALDILKSVGDPMFNYEIE